MRSLRLLIAMLALRRRRQRQYNRYATAAAAAEKLETRADLSVAVAAGIRRALHSVYFSLVATFVALTSRYTLNFVTKRSKEMPPVPALSNVDSLVHTQRTYILPGVKSIPARKRSFPVRSLEVHAGTVDDAPRSGQPPVSTARQNRVLRRMSTAGAPQV